MLRVFAIIILNIDILCDVMLGRLFIVMLSVVLLSVVLLSDVPLSVMFYCYAECRLFIVMLTVIVLRAGC